MPFTEEQMRQIYNTNIIDFAVGNGFEIEKSDKAAVHVKNNGGLFLFKHGRGYYSFTEEKGGNIVEFAMRYLGLEKLEAMELILGCRAYEQTDHNDSLGAVNHVSLAVNRACPYGYREFLDMLAPKPGGEYEFYRKFDCIGASSKTGIAGLLEETVRYTAMMSKYERVCREEEQAQEGEEDWER